MTDSLDEMLAGMVTNLKWEDLTGSRSRFRSYGGLKGYAISRITQDGVSYFRWARSQGGWSEVFLDADQAKAAAQQDYARRIISALNPDILRGMREAVIEECAKVAERMLVFADTTLEFDRAILTAIRSLSPKDPSNGK